MELADHRNNPNYEGWASMEVWPLKCGVDLIAAHMSQEFKDPEKFEEALKSNKDLITRIVTLAINNGNLACDKYGWDLPEVEEEVYSSINSMVEKDAFLRLIKDRGFPVHKTLWSSVKPESPKGKKLRSNQETKLLCQGIAIALWDMNPDMTIAEMAEQEILLEKGGGAIYSEKARREWLAEVDPRPREKKTGPKGQQKS